MDSLKVTVTLIDWPGAREPLADATQAAYQALVQPYWARIHACLHAEQMARSRTLAYEGGDRLLASRTATACITEATP